MSWTDAIPYMTRRELACQGTGKIRLDKRFACHFLFLRVTWGEPLYPNSVCRTPDHNASVGGHPRSLHLTKNPVHPTDGTMAADIRWRNWSTERKLQFCRLAWRLGWSIGLHDGFVHIDRRKDCGLEQRSFLYGEWSGSFDTEDVQCKVLEIWP